MAEALSYGLPVVGTKHAFEGYQIIHGENSYCGETAGEFVNNIKQYAALSLKERLYLKECSKILFKNKYSQISSNEIFTKILKERRDLE